MSAQEPPPSTGYPPQDQQPGAYPPQQGYPAEAYPQQQPGAYPPQQPGAYPPQQPGAYPPQEPGAYPPQQPGAYPPQQPAAYPPQPGYPAGAYPPQQPGAYPPQYPAGQPQHGAPPPYDYKQGAPQAVGAHQQASSNVIVVQQPRTAVVYQRHYGTGDHYALLSIILTMLCGLCCYWPALFCTIPAIIFSISAQEAEARGDIQGAKTSGNIALGLNIAAIGTYVILWIIFIILIAITY